jgi:hypothetical protein
MSVINKSNGKGNSDGMDIPTNLRPAPLSQPSYEHLLAANERLQAALAKASQGNALKLKISERGALSLYGLGRYATTLYRSQWERLPGAKEEIEGFIQANASKLSLKDQSAHASQA